jgi:hypothetical protein
MSEVSATHAWTEYPDGGAHCPACGSVRSPDGQVHAGHSRNPFLPPPCEPIPARHVVIDGVIVDGPPS